MAEVTSRWSHVRGGRQGWTAVPGRLNLRHPQYPKELQAEILDLTATPNNAAGSGGLPAKVMPSTARAVSAGKALAMLTPSTPRTLIS
jgi:hypothetical protein